MGLSPCGALGGIRGQGKSFKAHLPVPDTPSWYLLVLNYHKVSVFECSKFFQTFECVSIFVLECCLLFIYVDVRASCL